MRSVLGLSLFLCICAGCVFVNRGQRKDAEPAADTLVVFLTGNELGWLKPCGCSEGQLGGLNRRAAILGSVDQSRRLIIETGSLIPEVSDQMLIKFSIFLQAFQILEYDLVNLTAQDLEVMRQLNLVTEMKGQLGLTAAQGSSGGDLPDAFSQSFTLDGRDIEVQVRSVDQEDFDLDAAGSLFVAPDSANLVKILLVNGSDEAFAKSLAGRSLAVDCVICPVDMDEPEVLSEAGSPCLVISVGKKGRYVGKLTLRWNKRDARPGLSYVKLPVSEDLPYNEDMTRLYETYKDLVKAADLLGQYRKVPLDKGLTFVGSGACKSCHKDEYAIWQGKKHAHAYATLERVGSQYDPECVACHVVGLEYESGFKNEEDTPLLIDVGCEVCHGPGSKHVKSYGVAETVDPKKVCLDCHTPEHSAGYGGHEQEFLEKIRHWREP